MNEGLIDSCYFIAIIQLHYLLRAVTRCVCVGGVELYAQAWEVHGRVSVCQVVDQLSLQLLNVTRRLVLVQHILLCLCVRC